jgi:AcrR family transcriptional regulator
VEAILEASARILEEQGLEGYTTNAVADRAGVSIGSLYQYFPGKEALTAALIRRETARLVAEVTEAEMLSDWRRAISSMIDAAVAHQMRRPALAVLLDFQERRLPLEGDTQRVSEAFILNIGRVLQRSGLALHPRAAQDILAIVRGMIDLAGERGETDPMDIRRRVERAVFGYLGLSI